MEKQSRRAKVLLSVFVVLMVAVILLSIVEGCLGASPDQPNRDCNYDYYYKIMGGTSYVANSMGYFYAYAHVYPVLNVAVVLLPLVVIFACRKERKKSITLAWINLAVAILLAIYNLTTGYFVINNYYNIDSVLSSIFCLQYLIAAIVLLRYAKGTKKERLAVWLFIIAVANIIQFVVYQRCYYFRGNYYWYEFAFYGAYALLYAALGVGLLCDFSAIRQNARERNNTPKNKQTALFLSIFTGVLGVDRFYLGYTALGIFKLLTVGGAGIWALIDLIRISVDSLRPADGSPWVEETRDENIRSIAANMQAIAEKLEKLQAQSVPAEAEKPQTDGENQETHKVSLKK